MSDTLREQIAQIIDADGSNLALNKSQWWCKSKHYKVR